MRLIAEFGGKFLEWSTVVDCPVTYLMTKAELERYIRQEQGNRGLSDLEQRLARVAKTGTSSRYGLTKKCLLGTNRAGAGGAWLATEAEMVARYTVPPGADVCVDFP